MTEANIAFVAALLADPSRAAMCLALVGGEARPAGELAARAGVSPQTARLRDARTCYSHLAGRLGVALADALVTGRWLEEDGRRYRLTPAGRRSLRALGIDPRGHREQPAARRCLDWTERRPHIAGPVGTALATLALERGWIRRVRGTRAVVVTPAGRTELQQIFHV